MKSEDEEFYDNEIAPALLELSRKCADRGLPFFAQVEYQASEFGRTVAFPKGAHLAMKMLLMCAQSRDNVDLYIMSLGRYARENDVPYDNSAVMNQFFKTNT